jgi:hypothetical protein
VSSVLGHSWLAKRKLEIFLGRVFWTVSCYGSWHLTWHRSERSLCQDPHCAEILSQDDWEPDESTSCGKFSFKLTWEAQVHFADHTELWLWKTWLASQVYGGWKGGVGIWCTLWFRVMGFELITSSRKGRCLYLSASIMKWILHWCCLAG